MIGCVYVPAPPLSSLKTWKFHKENNCKKWSYISLLWSSGVGKSVVLSESFSRQKWKPYINFTHSTQLVPTSFPFCSNFFPIFFPPSSYLAPTLYPPYPASFLSSSIFSSLRSPFPVPPFRVSIMMYSLNGVLTIKKLASRK